MAGQKFIAGIPRRRRTGQGVNHRWTLDPRQQINADLLPADDTGFFDYFQFYKYSDRTEVDFQTAPTLAGSIDVAGTDLLPAWEEFESAIVIDAGGVSLEIAGPNHSVNTDRDATEPYNWELSSSDETRVDAFFTEFYLLTRAERGATTITLRTSVPPPVEASQTFIVGAAVDTTTADGHKLNTWTLDPQQQINADLLAVNLPGYFGYFQFNDQLTSAEVSLNTSSALGGDVSVRGPDLIAEWEASLFAVLIEAGGISLNIPGPAYRFNADLDHTEPYAWELSALDGPLARTFFTAYALLTQSQKNATTITLRTSLVSAALSATAAMAGASAAALGATASLLTPRTLLLQDFNQAGLDVDVLGIFVAAAPANIYANSDRGGTQSPLAGSDFGIGSGETIISRIIVANNGTTIILNDNDKPTALTMSAHFGSSNTDSDWTLYIQTLDGVASTLSLRTTGGGFAQWRMDAEDAVIINGIGAGDRVILAIAKPGAAVDLAATAELAGASVGALVATASLQTPTVLQATAELAGAVAGALVATAELQTHAVLRATVELVGAAAGVLVVTASLQSLDVLQPTAALAGEATGTLTATASLVTPDVLQATGSMSGEASGDVTAAATASEVLLLTDFPKAGLDIDVLGLFVAAAKPSVYLASSQALESGEFGMGAGETLLTHIRVLANGANIRLNDANLPSALVLNTHFGASNTTSDWTLYIQTLDGTASTNALSLVGGNFANWRMGNDGAAIANAIVAGDRVIFAIAKASAIPSLGATGAFAGAAAGELAGTASLVTPAVLNAGATFAGESTGELTGTASLLIPATLNATASMAGAAAGELAATASLLSLDVLRPTAAFTGESAGELVATASLLTLDVLRPTATFTGAAVGELFGAVSLLDPAAFNATASMAGASTGALGASVSLKAPAVLEVLQATASMSGKAEGLLQNAALLGAAIPVTKLSAAALNRINAFGLHGNKPLTCIEIYHPDVPDNIRVVNDSDDLFIGPDRYLRAAFSATIPQDKEGELPRGELHIDNVGRAMVEWIELSQGGRGAKISIREVFIPVAGNRNAEVSWEITGLDVGRIRMTNERVTAELTDNRVAKAPAVKLRHDVIESPGLQ